MSVLTGLILDVSDSMSEKVPRIRGSEKWATSIFKVAQDLLRHGRTHKHQTFAFGVGACITKGPPVFDLFNTLRRSKLIEEIREDAKSCEEEMTLEDIISRAVSIIENNGAPSIRDWAADEVIKKQVSKETASMILACLRNDEHFRHQLIHEFLPSICRRQKSTPERPKSANSTSRFDKDSPDSFIVFKNILETELSLDIDRNSLGIRIAKDPAMAVLGEIKILTNHSETQKKASESAELDLREILNLVMEVAEKNGAPFIRQWLTVKVVKELKLADILDKQRVSITLAKLRLDESFLKKFVAKLPAQCRTETESPRLLMKCGDVKVRVAQAITPEFKVVSEVRDVIQKAERAINAHIVGIYTPRTIFKATDALALLKCQVGELSDDTLNALLAKIEPYIYGGTPMNQALRDAVKVFKDYAGDTKVLFILSDGLADDGSPPLKELREAGVIVISCYITMTLQIDPRRLYCLPNQNWIKATRYMYNLSSTISTQKIPRTFFVERDWRIDFANNETRLFAQVNHPENMREFCQLARDVVWNQDALSDVLSSISLDLLINKANESFAAKRQEEGTCYANAVATVVYLAMKRIYKRRGGYPFHVEVNEGDAESNFFELRKLIIGEYGTGGADTYKVLQKICKAHRLHCEKVDILGAMRAVAAQRPVVARFRLSESEWVEFDRFYAMFPSGTLDKSYLDISKRSKGEKKRGHAVVMTSFDSHCFRFMNSWGSEFGDGGFFRVKDHTILNFQFFDVYWQEGDLFQGERNAYKRSGAAIAENLMKQYTFLRKEMQKCPECLQDSKVTDYTGHVLSATCPKCQATFSTKDTGANLALGLYLLSLCNEKSGNNVQ